MAAVAVTLGVVASAVVRGRVLPPWTPPLAPVNRWRLPTEAFDFAFLLSFCLTLGVVYPLLTQIGWTLIHEVGLLDRLYGPLDPSAPASGQIRQLAGVLVAAPAIGGLWLMYRLRAVGRPRRSLWHVVRDLAFGVWGWLVLTPLAFGVHAVTNVIAQWAGVPPDEHALTVLGVGESNATRFVFALSVCLLTPLAEEILFRGLLVGWAVGRWYRPWALLLLAAAFALLSGLGGAHGLAPLGFVATLGVGFAVLPVARAVRPRFPLRTTRAVYATAAIFAAAHSAVWPTPVPLFVLGLGLGYLAARSNGVTASTLTHGLFNAVSFVFLLRGPG